MHLDNSSVDNNRHELFLCYAGNAAGQGGAAGGAHSKIGTVYRILCIVIVQELRKDKEERQEARKAGGGGGKGRWPSLSEEHRQKIRASNTGKVKGPQSEDHRRCALGAAVRDVILRGAPVGKLAGSWCCRAQYSTGGVQHDSCLSLCILYSLKTINKSAADARSHACC